VILNASAYNAVDRAESEVDLAEAVNAHAPAVLAEAAARSRAVLIHYSTDYVFDGTAGRPYRETDRANPINAYGRSKRNGEVAVEARAGAYLILRTSWVYSLRRQCFVTQVLEWSRTRDELRIAADQTGSPTWCRVIAQATAEILSGAGPDPWASLGARSGIYHLAGIGAASRFAWAAAILRFDPHSDEQRVGAGDLRSACRADFAAAAERPTYSALDSGLLCETFGLSLPAWDEALRLALEES
jgi:dTDP-4-dehydrorhamnose reductase